VVCLGRVGSEYLNSLLSSHPEIDAWGELFRPDGEFETSGLDDPQAFLESIGRSGRVTVFKLSFHALNTHPETRKLPGRCTIVRLRREDLLSQYVSGVLALKAGSWRQEGYRDTRVVLRDPVLHLRRLVARERRLDRLISPHPAFEITYEQIPDRLPALQQFLGLQALPLSTDHERLRKRPLDEVVENWPEVVNALRGTEFERFVTLSTKLH
jgi:hypothetical protein